MFLIRSLMKVVLLPFMIVLTVAGIFVKIALELSSVVTGALTFFIFCCFVSTVVRQQWNQALILFIMESGIVLAAFGAELIDTALERMSRGLAEFLQT